MTTYQVTKEHLTGALRGLTTTETTSVEFQVGTVHTSALTGSRYRVIKIETVREIPKPTQASRADARAAEREWTRGFQ